MSGRARSEIAAPRSDCLCCVWHAATPSLVRQHALHGLRIRGRDLNLAGELRLPARRLLGQDVRMEGVIALQFSAPGLLEPFRGTTMRLQLRHNFPLKACCVTLLSRG